LEFVSTWIDDRYVFVNKKFTILQACEKVYKDIPRFCYHEKLSIAGNCRMCLVEASNSKKLVASCAMNISQDVQIYTNTLRIKAARESVLEFLLLNHPLDCPICDQGGECDLQDLTFIYGSDRGRAYEITKRAVEDKNLGILIKTIMTRCIHCTRCVRFMEEATQTYKLGVTGRGNSMEIGTYIESFLHNPLSANIVDICPVGALTSKPYAFTNRPWELESWESFDLQDSLGSSIRIDTYGNKVVRILPVSNPFINEDWITNVARFSYDALDAQRLLSPMIKVYQNNIFSYVKTSWLYTFSYIKSTFERLNFRNVNNILDVSFLDIESLIAWKDLIHGLGMSMNSKNYGDKLLDIRSNFLFEPVISDLEDIQNVLCVGVEMLPIIRLRLKNSELFYIGNSSNKKSVGHYSVLSKLASGMSSFCKKMLKKGCLILYGLEELANSSLLNIIEKKTKVRTSLLQWKAGFIGALDIGIPYNLGIDFGQNTWNYFVHSEESKKVKGFTIFQGYHGGKQKENVILPTKNFMEKTGIYSNTEGAFFETRKVSTESKNMRSDWEIFSALLLFLMKSLRKKGGVIYGKLKKIRNRLGQVAPLRYFNKFYSIRFYKGKAVSLLLANKELTDNNEENYYIKNNFLKNSRILTHYIVSIYKTHFTYA
jgi:NADH dehydrogenase (ubiquinone) Fe-S protein 1